MTTLTLTHNVAWTVPAGVTSIALEGIGGGGGSDRGRITRRGHGAAGGQGARKVLTVSPGDSVLALIGAGGVGSPNTSTNPTSGEDTTIAVNGTIVLRAKGGAAATPTAIGTGSTTGGVGDSIVAGGDGTTGLSFVSGTSGNGGAGADLTTVGGTLVGGAGGLNPSGTASAGANGDAPGGGGSGGGNATGFTGGNGAEGIASVTYTPPAGTDTQGVPIDGTMKSITDKYVIIGGVKKSVTSWYNIVGNAKKNSS